MMKKKLAKVEVIAPVMENPPNTFLMRQLKKFPPNADIRLINMPQ